MKKKHLKKCPTCGKKKWMRSDRTYCSVKCANGRKNSEERIMVFSDTHVPFHDEKVWSIIKQVAKLYKPTRVIIAGDFLDCRLLSRKFSQPGDGGPTFGEEIDIGVALLEELRASVKKSCNILLQEGNHSHRLKQLLNSGDGLRLKGVKGLTIPAQLELDRLNIDYQECSGDKWFTVKTEIAPGFWVGHFDRVSGWAGYAAKNIQDRFAASFMTGHGHSGGVVHRTTANGTIWGYELGCTCSINPQYMDPTSWVQMVSLVTIDDGLQDVERLVIDNGRTRYRGVVLNG